MLALLITAGVVLLAVAQGGSGLIERLGLGQDTEQEVFETTDALRRSEPGMFGEFEPYTRQELESGGTTHRPRGRPVHPRERARARPRPAEAVPEATHYTLSIFDEAGTRL
jgi:hypothetical protein